VQANIYSMTGGSSAIQAKPVEIVYDEERIKILIDDTRKQILSTLSDSDMDLSVTEIADRLRTKPQRIYHHVDKLVEFNFLQKTREERKKRSITSYYARTAKAFIISYSTDRGFIHNQGLIDHFIESLQSILGIGLTDDEEIEIGDLISQLSVISERIFSSYSNRDDDEIQRHSIENLYFLIELLLFYRDENARDIIDQLTDNLLPKLQRSSNWSEQMKF